MKLAVFSGQYFWFDGKHYSTDEAFVKFVTSFYPYFEKIIFCDPVRKERKTESYILDPTKAEVCPLPYFSVYSFWKNILVIYPKIYRVIRDNIHHWDIIWLHGPHPVSLIFAYVCRRLHKPFFLFIRQNLKVYVGYRNRGAKRRLALSVASMLEYIFRHLFRDTLTFAVGKEMFDIYGKTGRRVHETAVSLVSDGDIGYTAHKQLSDNPNQIRLLSVGRFDPEKGVIYLIQALHELVANRKTNITLRLVGKGSEENRLRLEVHKRGLTQYIHFLGYVPHNSQLFSLYRESDIFVLPSLTEGCPQTLFEAMVCGVPVVATNVGGVPYLVQDGENGLLVNPASAREICGAVKRVISDPELRDRLVTNGLATVRNHTLQAERDRMIVQIQRLLNSNENGGSGRTEGTI